MDIDKVQDILERLAEELPEEFYKHLNGGILLLPDVKLSPEVVPGADDLYIMGQYIRSSSMGKIIHIYHGSFEKIYGNMPDEIYEQRLREVLRHEFRHHLEGLAGENGLEKEDKLKIRKYKAMHGLK